METYLEYVSRSLHHQQGSRLELELRALPGGPLTEEVLRPLALANTHFLDGLANETETEAPPSTSALVAVPLLVQLVRDWSSEGQRVRDTSYRPIVGSLLPFLLDRHAPRILVPGSGTGRLAYMLAERLRGSRVVALDPDVHAQLAAAFFLTGGKMELLGDGGGGSVSRGDSGGGSVSSASPGRSTAHDSSVVRLPYTIYPSLHVATNWASVSHRLAPVRVPDVPLPALRRVEKSSNVTFVVGSLEEAAAQWLAGGSLDGSEDESAITSRNGFDAVATCFTLDVLSDLVLSLRALHAMLLPSHGLWVNLGPLAFPSPHEGLVPSTPAAIEQSRAAVLTAEQQLHLVRAAGFELIEERLVDGCEYNVLPHRLERTVRTCLFFVARPARHSTQANPKSSATTSARGQTASRHDEL